MLDSIVNFYDDIFIIAAGKLFNGVLFYSSKFDSDVTS